eukprot:3986303-Alexandrium_andersonii.AAC.1
MWLEAVSPQGWARVRQFWGVSCPGWLRDAHAVRSMSVHTALFWLKRFPPPSFLALPTHSGGVRGR